ncbi:hypothetical protein ASG76_03915 [Nocardioides sp. Soil774]|uniref:hypothetical protein n=1 Tax=Nocardioides sp. Soil774 TaxID=1736408 RepID=UPI0006F91B0B|nr:hypothetical protein [Nocardioides sp. Soil774]KRE96192.1 hypothetical protein ASG76_03915 [Nocardioides sp. Soil774]
MTVPLVLGHQEVVAGDELVLPELHRPALEVEGRVALACLTRIDGGDGRQVVSGGHADLHDDSVT